MSAVQRTGICRPCADAFPTDTCRTEKRADLPAMSREQDSIVVPSNQLELEDHNGDWVCAADQDAPDSPPCWVSDEDASNDPPSLSRTPSGDLLVLAQWQDSTPAPTDTWSQYSGTIFDDHRGPIEVQLSEQLIGDRWSIGPIIGRGSFGCCYKAIDTQSGQQVRLAVLPAARMRGGKVC